MENVRFVADGCEYFVYELDAEGLDANGIDVLEVIRSELSSKIYTDVVIIAHGYNTSRNSDGSLLHANSIVPALERRRPSGRTCLYIGISWPSFFTTVLDGEKEPPKQSKELVTKVLRMVRSNVRAEVPNINGSPGSPDSSKINQAIAKMQDEANKILDGSSFDSGADKFYPELWDVIADFADELDKDEEQDGSDDINATATDPDNDAGSARLRLGNLKLVPHQLKKRAKQLYDSGRSRFETDDHARKSRMLYKTTLRMRKVGKLPKGMFEVFYGTFETRASIIGARGVHKLIADIMKATTSHLRIHLFGHSLGAITVLAAVSGENNVSYLSRKLHSIMLMQGACPANIVSQDGPYHSVLSNLEPVAGPILATVAYDDLALKATEVFRPVAIGRAGFNSTDPYKMEEVQVERIKSATRTMKASLRKRCCYNVISDDVISDHNEVDVKEIMDIFWQAATIEMEVSDYTL